MIVFMVGGAPDECAKTILWEADMCVALCPSGGSLRRAVISLGSRGRGAHLPGCGVAPCGGEGRKTRCFCTSCSTPAGPALHHRQNTPIWGPNPGIPPPIPAHTAGIRRSRPCRRHRGNPLNAAPSPAALAASMIVSNTKPSNPLHAAVEREGMWAEMV